MSEFLANALASNAVRNISHLVAETSQECFDQNPYCAEHPGQPLVAYEANDTTFRCQACLFEASQPQQPLFIVSKAREIKDS